MRLCVVLLFILACQGTLAKKYYLHRERNRKLPVSLIQNMATPQELNDKIDQETYKFELIGAHHRKKIRSYWLDREANKILVLDKNGLRSYLQLADNEKLMSFGLSPKGNVLTHIEREYDQYLGYRHTTGKRISEIKVPNMDLETDEIVPMQYREDHLTILGPSYSMRFHYLEGQPQIYYQLDEEDPSIRYNKIPFHNGEESYMVGLNLNESKKKIIYNPWGRTGAEDTDNSSNITHSWRKLYEKVSFDSKLEISYFDEKDREKKSEWFLPYKIDHIAHIKTMDQNRVLILLQGQCDNCNTSSGFSLFNLFKTMKYHIVLINTKKRDGRIIGSFSLKEDHIVNRKYWFTSKYLHIFQRSGWSLKTYKIRLE
jgi:hypothetical protein